MAQTRKSKSPIRQPPSKEVVSVTNSKLFWVTTAIRVSLLVFSPPALLQSVVARSILINPVWTLTHIHEASAIRQLNLSATFADAYSGRTIHVPPLTLAAAESLLSHVAPSWQYLSVGLLLLVVDIWIAIRLQGIAARLLQQEESREDRLLQQMDTKIQPAMAHIFPTGTSKDDVLFCVPKLPFFIAQLYYSNPIMVLAGCLSCFQSLRLLLVLEAIHCSITACNSRGDGKSAVVWTAFCMALATYLDFHCIVFLVPILIWYGGMTIGFVFDLITIVLQGLSYLLTGDRYLSVVKATHLNIFGIIGLPPSLSTVWYFGMQVFIRFRLYFTLLLAALPYLLVVPIAIRLYKYPSVLVAIFWFLSVLFRPPGTLYDVTVGFCLMLLNPRSMAYMLQLPSLVSFCALPVPVILYSVGYWMWIEPGSGEANYLYFQCLAYNIFVALLFLNFCSGSLRRDKALRLTEKLRLSKNSSNGGT